MSSRFCRRGRGRRRRTACSGRAIFLPYQHRFPGHGFIYRLLDPITAEPRYVGRSRTPAIRRHGHRSRRPKKKSPVTAWHRRLALHGLIPVMQILEGPVSYAQAAIREEAWRRAHVAAGSELLNAVPCVDGRHDGNTIWTAETAGEEVRALASRLQLGGAYPTRRQFADSGLSGLDTAIERRLGGHRAIAAALGLVMPTPGWTLAAADTPSATSWRSMASSGIRRQRSSPTPMRVACSTRSPLTSGDTRCSHGDSASPERETNGRARRPMLPSSVSSPDSEALVDIPPTARCAGTDRRAGERRTPLRRQPHPGSAARPVPASARGPGHGRGGRL